MKKHTALALLAFAALVLNASAETLAQWNFNSNPPDANTATGTLAPSTGAGTAVLVGGLTQAYFGGSTSDASSAGDNSGWSTTSYPASGAANKTAGVEFRVSTVGFETVTITWDHRNSASASKYLRLQYSADGVNFTDNAVITQTAAANSFSSQSVSLAAIGAAENNPNFAFRLVTEFESTATGAGAAAYVTIGASAYTSGGTLRYDLVTITGSPATGNTSPTITAIPNQTIRVNESTPELPFTVGDVETPVGDLIVTGTSSNPALIPIENLLFGGLGASRNITVSPNFESFGTATITVSVLDGGGKSSLSSFVVTVLPGNTPPTLSNSFTNYHTLKDVAVPSISFTVGDLESPAADLEILVSSSNPTVIPEASVVPGGSGANRTVTITPAAGEVGNSVITITVSDFVLTTSRSFNVMVVPSASVVLSEPFEYSNGPFTTNSGGLWNNHSGIFGQVQVSGGILQMLSSQTEDINARLIGSPYPTSGGTVLYASFVANFSSLPSENADYFAHYREVGGAQRCRIFVSTTNSPAGTFRFGIANNNASITNGVTLEGDLATGVDHFLLVRYDVTTGISTLWVNPTSESSPSITATDTPAPSSIASFAFRQSNNIGSPRIDNLKVGLALSDVATLAPAVRLSIARTVSGIEISWPASATDAGYGLRSSATLNPSIDWQPVGGAPVRNGSRDSVTLNNPVGNRFYQLVK